MTVFNPNVADRSDTTNFLGPIGGGKTLSTPTPYKKNFTASATINPRRIVKFNGTATTVIEGAAATDLLLGVSTNLVDAVSGEEVDVVMAGETQVVAGAAVAIGVFLTADADGRAVTAAATNRAVGYALTSAAAAGDVITVFVNVCTA